MNLTPFRYNVNTLTELFFVFTCAAAETAEFHGRLSENCPPALQVGNAVRYGVSACSRRGPVLNFYPSGYIPAYETHIISMSAAYG